ncbi:MAG: GNAT family N-acetyltransferase [Candidatus Pacebacteria bacterium]|nr:GNAT family N-acetyltransferase [Candidatus Paceibacterota bacterium]
MEKPVIKTLSKAILRRFYGEIIRIDRNQMKDFEKWDKDNFLLDLPLKFKLSFFVISKKKLIGYGIISQKSDSAHIHRIAVSPEYTGRGIGHQMIRFLKQKARNHDCYKIVAETLKGIKSNKFYQKEGFKKLSLTEQKKYALTKKPDIRRKFMKESYVFELKI